MKTVNTKTETSFSSVKIGYIKSVFVLFALFSFSSVNGANLNIGNGGSYTVSGNEVWDGLIIGNNFATLTIPAGASLTINGNASVGNTAIFNTLGTLTITGLLDINNNATINVDGTLNLGAIEMNNGGVLDVSGSGSIDVDGDFTAKNGTTINVDLGGVVDIGGDFSVATGGGSSINVDGTVTVVGQYTGPTAVGDGTMTDSDESLLGTPLPITLLSARVNMNFDRAIISWSTATEINNERFEISRSLDMQNWSFMGTVYGNGNSESVINYSFTDTKIPFGQVYYQIRQIDFNGEQTIIATLSLNVEIETQFSIYPNPMQQGDQINILGLSDTNQVTIYNTKMQVVNQNSLEKGLYFVIIDQNAPIKVVVN